MDKNDKLLYLIDREIITKKEGHLFQLKESGKRLSFIAKELRISISRVGQAYDKVSKKLEIIKPLDEINIDDNITSLGISTKVTNSLICHFDTLNVTIKHLLSLDGKMQSKEVMYISNLGEKGRKEIQQYINLIKGKYQ